MERLTREMTFEEEYTFLKKEVKELFYKEDKESEPPESHNVVRRALRCIKKLVSELEPYKAYKDLEEQGLLLRLPCKVGDTVYIELASYFDIGTYTTKYADADVRDFIHFTSCGFCVVVTSKVFGKLTIPFSDFGKTVFLTKAEAENKLKETESK